MADLMPYRKFPCNECPIRADNCDNPRSKFPAERWAALSVTVRDPQTGRQPMPGEIMFGCHKGEPGTDRDLACAGWLAQFGSEHIGVRLAVTTGRLPESALETGENWPPLHQTWQDVVRAQTAPARAEATAPEFAATDLDPVDADGFLIEEPDRERRNNVRVAADSRAQEVPT